MINLNPEHYPKLSGRYMLVAFILLLSSHTAYASEDIIVTVSSNTDITVTRFTAAGKYLMVWMAPEYGFRPRHRAMAQMLSEQGIEVWQTNIVDALFLPQGLSSIKQLDGTYVADLIEYAHKETGKKIVVSGDSYATTTALIGAHQWQSRQHSEPYLIGAVLFSPYTFAYIPQLGMSPEYMPIVSATNIPIMIYMAKKNGTIGRFNDLVEKLQQHNNPVYTRMTPDVMSLFYQDPPTQAMITHAEPIPQSIKQMIAVLEKHPAPAEPVPLPHTDNINSGIDIALKAFNGNKAGFNIDLIDLDGKRVIKRDFSGKVTLINFWATWCPPCVEEIPSLNRLQRKMRGRAFEVISINYAEDKHEILDFIEKVEVEYPVLLDMNGEFAQQMNVVTYPSTFVIDLQGKIRYGVNAAIEWDTPEVVRQLTDMTHKGN